MMVSEMRGVFASGASEANKRQWIALHRSGSGVGLSYPNIPSPVLTPAEARKLADQLYELASTYDKEKAK